MLDTNDLCDEVLISLRRIMRAVDLQSRQLVRRHGLTGPQTYLLKELSRMREATVGELADRVSLSMPTVTDILNRLEKRGLVMRARSAADKRCVTIRVTAAGEEKLAMSPPLLQEEFARQFRELQQWEQLQFVACLKRIAEMLHARDLDAAPVLSSGPLSAPPEVAEVATTGTAEGGSNTPTGSRQTGSGEG